MTATTDILAFATGGGANVISQAAYAALTSLLANGFSAGIAQSDQLNKVWRQSAFISAGVANFCVAQGVSVPDDGNLSNLVTEIEDALEAFIAAHVNLSSVFQGIKVTSFTSGGTWTPDTNNLFTVAAVQGAGGGGGGAANSSSQPNSASGGGAGAFALALLTKAQASTSQAITIGAAGTAGANTGGSGGSGGTSSIGSLISCTGGAGGAQQSNPGSNGQSAGGAGGAVTISTGTSILSKPGGDGGYGGSNVLGVSGYGGSAPCGSGGAQIVYGNGDNPGIAAKGFGGGGSGAAINNTGQIGGVGTAGFVVLVEFIA